MLGWPWVPEIYSWKVKLIMLSIRTVPKYFSLWPQFGYLRKTTQHISINLKALYHFCWFILVAFTREWMRFYRVSVWSVFLNHGHLHWHDHMDCHTRLHLTSMCHSVYSMCCCCLLFLLLLRLCWVLEEVLESFTICQQSVEDLWSSR